MHRDLGPRGDPPAERALRRQARPPAGARDRRAAAAHVARRALPAGGRPRRALQGRLRVRPGLHGPGAGPPPRRPRRAHGARRADRGDARLPERRPGAGRRRVPAPQPRRSVLERRLPHAQDRPLPGGPRAGRGRPQRRGEGRDARRPGRAGRRRRGRRDRRAARRGSRQGPARQGRSPRRPPVRDRPDRAAGVTSELRADGGLRHPADGRHELPVLGVAAERGTGARRPDRHRRAHDRAALPDGRAPRGRRARDARVADPAARAQGGSRVARADRGERRGLVAADGGAGDGGRRPDQPAARHVGAEQPAAGRRDPHRGLGLVDELVGAAAATAPRDDGLALRHARDDGARACPTRSPRSWRTRTAR